MMICKSFAASSNFCFCKSHDADSGTNLKENLKNSVHVKVGVIVSLIVIELNAIRYLIVLAFSPGIS